MSVPDNIPPEAYPSYKATGAALPQDVGLREMLLAIWRRRWLMAVCMLAALCVGMFILTQITPLYRATAKVMLDPRELEVTETADLMSSLPFDNAMSLNEVQVLGSRELAKKTVKRLQLHRNPEFNSAILTAQSYDTQVAEEVAIESAANTLMKRTSVQTVGRSLVLRVSIDSERPNIAMRVTNGLVSQYLDDQLNEKFIAAQRATDWLERRLTELAENLKVSSQAVEDYRKKNNLISGYKTDVTSQQISEINTQLVLSTTQLAEAQARLEQVEFAQSNGRGIEAVSEVIGSRLIQDLKREEAEIVRKYSELSSRYGAKHPKIQDVRAELREHRGEISSEIRKIVSALESEVEVAQARLNSLNGSLDSLEGQQADDKSATIGLAQLKREADTDRIVYESFLQRMKETREQEQVQKPDARIISAATLPKTPHSPNRLAVLAFAAISGAFFGLLLVFVIEQFDSGFRTPKHLEEVTGIRCLSMIPDVRLKKGLILADYILDNPYSMVAEAIRTMRISLMAANEIGESQVVCVTSSLPSEGKTTISGWLARTAAQSGRKVLLIDCDLRKPSIHALFGDDNDVSLIDVLSGKRQVDELISIDEKTGLHRIYGKPMQMTQHDLLGSEKMNKLIKMFKEAYSLIVIDTPPTLAVSDSRLLARFADKLLYNVQWDRTPKEVVIAALKQLKDNGITPDGIVLTRVNLKKHATYGYGDAAGYYQEYGAYFKG